MRKRKKGYSYRLKTFKSVPLTIKGYELKQKKIEMIL